MRVPPARIREHEDPGRVEKLVLPTELHRSPVVEESAVHGDADERHDRGSQAPDLGQEQFAPGRELFGAQVGNTRRGSIDEVHEPEPVLRKRCILLVANVLGNEPGLTQEFPETVRMPGEVVPQSGRTHAWVDADEQDPEPRRNAIGEGPEPGPRSGRASGVLVPWRLRHA